MSREQRVTEITRRGAHRNRPKRVLIVSQGEVIEPFYFDGLKDEENIQDFALHVIHKPLDPIRLVEHALRIPQYPSHDQVWVLFDRDDTPDEQIEKAIRIAKKDAKITCALSDPCFDLWLLLHIRDINHPIERKDIYEKIKAKHPTFDEKKNKIVLYKDIKTGVDKAISRAKAMEDKHLLDGTRPPPSTCVWRLVSMLLKRNYQRSCPIGKRNCVACC